MNEFRQEARPSILSKRQSIKRPACFIDDNHHMNYNIFKKTKCKTDNVTISVFGQENNRIDLWLRKLAKNTSRFKEVQNIEISFPFSFKESVFVEVSHQLAQLENLKKLIINSIQSTNVTDKAIASLGKSLTRLSTLETLHIDFSRFIQITDRAIHSIGQSICRSKTLKSFSLSVSTCEKLTNKSLIDISSKLVKIKSLNSLVLEYNNCQEVNDDGLVGLGQNLAKMTNLSYINLNFYMCSLADRGVSTLGECLAKIPNIKKLDLFFSCGLSTNWSGLSVSGIELLCSNIAKLQALDKLSLKFGWSDTLDDHALHSINNNLLKLKNLSSLELGFYFCKSITNDGVSQLTKNFGKLLDTNIFKFNIWSCDQVTDAGIIDTCLNVVKLPNLKHFEINSDSFGWKLFHSQKKVLDFATSLMLKKTHKQFSKHKNSIFVFFSILTILSIFSLLKSHLLDPLLAW